MTTTPFMEGAGGAPAALHPPTRLHPRDHLLATVSHELRQPLGLSMGALIKPAVQSQGRIIDDLLDISVQWLP